MAKIVILGGGFGGIYAAKTLLKGMKNSEHKIVLVNRSEHFVFIPLLHEAAAEFLEEADIMQDIPSVLKAKNFEFLKAEATKIDFSAKIVETREGKVGYDFLLIALGSVPNTAILAKTASPSEKVHVLKSLEDAKAIKARLKELADHYLASKSEKKAINIVFIGCGATGIELVGEVSEFYRRHFAGIEKTNEFENVNIYLIDKNDRILPQVDDAFREKALKRLEKGRVGVIYYKAEVDRIENGKVAFQSGGKTEEIAASMVFLTAGVVPNPIETAQEKDKKIKNERGCFEVDEFLQVKNAQNAWAVGDNAFYINPKDNKPVPMLAQSAKDEGIAAAKNIISKLTGKEQRKYVFNMKGFLLSIGRGYGVGEIFSHIFSGWHVWWLKRTVYTLEFIGIRKKMQAFSMLSLKPVLELIFEKIQRK